MGVGGKSSWGVGVRGWKEEEAEGGGGREGVGVTQREQEKLKGENILFF